MTDAESQFQRTTTPGAVRAEYREIESMRHAYLQETNCQIVHDSIHARKGWAVEYLLTAGRGNCGYGSVAVVGPWKAKPTVFEFYLAPNYRTRAFELFEAFLTTSNARCNPMNVASHRTLQRAGFVPFAHILAGSIPSTPVQREQSAENKS